MPPPTSPSTDQGAAPRIAPQRWSDNPDALAGDLLTWLRSVGVAANVAGMARYGINPDRTLGVPIPVLRAAAARLRRLSPALLHDTAAHLWASGLHEARILAGIVDVPALVTEAQADAWVADLDSWDVCDQLQKLFVSTSFGYDKAVEWAGQEETFVKRAGFVLMATIAVHDKGGEDVAIIGFLRVVEAEADDERNYVRKAANWALRQIGKRSPACHEAAIDTAERILVRHEGSAAARWVARDALRELRSEQVGARLGIPGPASHDSGSDLGLPNHDFRHRDVPVPPSGTAARPGDEAGAVHRR